MFSWHCFSDWASWQCLFYSVEILTEKRRVVFVSKNSLMSLFSQRKKMTSNSILDFRYYTWYSTRIPFVFPSVGLISTIILRLSKKFKHLSKKKHSKMILVVVISRGIVKWNSNALSLQFYFLPSLIIQWNNRKRPSINKPNIF